LFEIATALIVAAPEADVSLLCVSSPSLLRDLQDDFGHLTTPKREEALMLRVSTLINEVAGLWQDAEKNPLTQAQAAETNDKLKGLMQEMQGK
jgi:5'-deoxynucleotidase YfbR-like HD superfamily hydrolase